MAQKAAQKTAAFLLKKGAHEIKATRGESAYVWKQGSVYMASVIEGLGTKNLVADAMRKVTDKTYYDVVAHDTVATIINDLVTVGATPLVLHAYWASGSSEWFADHTRVKDLVTGWQKACTIAKVTWGGGETPAYAGIIDKDTIDLAGSAVGIVQKKKNLITQDRLKTGDHIIFIKSNGINANGLTLARSIADRLPEGFATSLPDGKSYGETLLTKSNMYASLIYALQKANIDIHYIVNITGHGLRKLMRAQKPFTYSVERLFKPQPIFEFIKKHENLSDSEMYATFNMGQDYCLFVPPRDVKKTLAIIKKNGFVGLDAGIVKKGKKQVILQEKAIAYTGDSLMIR
ncbi:phosphoribosylformylglycinamidine cyclo-ligase [Candidatus Uhrbacteria bacterium]|nr:phosphoribosylformylglycinamidine cyclo-ligase [Candidatus Uhrbacteria bacterium]